MKIADFELERFFAKYEFTAPYLLCSSDPESFSLEELLSFEPGSIDAFKKQWLGYTETQGSLKLRNEITKTYKNIMPENILVHSGAEEGIFIFMNVALEKGDHVIVQFPAYQSLYEVASAIGCEVTKWTLKEKDNWELDIDFLKKNIRKDTKAIILNLPHNPTGYLPSKNKLEEIIKIARENNIIIFSDEVYRFLEYNESDRLPAICDLYENGVSVGGMSKAFALPGLRICWSATKNKEILNKMAAFKDYTTICSSAPSEFLSIIALKHKEKIFKRNLEIIKTNLKTLDDFFKRYKDTFNFQAPKAGTIAFPSIKLETDIEKFCIDLIEKKGVFLLPSTKYDFGNKNFRVGFGRKNMPQCLKKFEEYLNESHSKRVILSGSKSIK
ncbi:MAG: aminotransferase class I/II-fold pyridoxal phosphate-dependent enzyme [Candidatus Melainabacteria bacterium]|nr:aminotransferase class I/II-fold pyridoxal phosphate-dependent enzyme [Candidatus Melainabacteria bacterium]